MESGLGKLKNFQSGSQSYLNSYNTSVGSPNLLEFLTHSGLIKPLDKFETFPRTEFPNWQDRECNSLVSRFLRNLRDRNKSSSRKKRRDELLAHIASLSEALAVTARSHSALLKERVPDAPDTAVADIDMQQVFADLKAAIAAFDPRATDFVDQLLAAVEQGGGLFQTLLQAREHLDNFSFDQAEPLLLKIEEEMSSTA